MTMRTTMPARQALLRWTDEKFDATSFLKAPAPPFHVTAYGALFADDCMNVLPLLKDDAVDTVFADPPFNLGKEYGKKTDDKLPDDHYIQWCRRWLAECVRVLKPGGSLFLYNLPKWNVILGAFLTDQGSISGIGSQSKSVHAYRYEAAYIQATTAFSITARENQRLFTVSVRLS